jgi:hypothetical protein
MVKTGNPTLLAKAVEANALAPDIEAFLKSLELTEAERKAVAESMTKLQMIVTPAKDAPYVRVYNGWG